jgi:hypothetical protein
MRLFGAAAPIEPPGSFDPRLKPWPTSFDAGSLRMTMAASPRGVLESKVVRSRGLRGFGRQSGGAAGVATKVVRISRLAGAGCGLGDLRGQAGAELVMQKENKHL